MNWEVFEAYTSMHDARKAREELFRLIVGNRGEPIYSADDVVMHDNPVLVAEICKAPEEDTPRLLYADWLDEATGYIQSEYAESYRARAELIRLQIEVAHGANCPVCKKVGRFRGTWRQWCALNHIDLANTDIHPDKQVDQECVACNYLEKQRRVRWLLDSTYVVEVKGFKGAGAGPRISGKELWKPADLAFAREVRFVRGFVGVVSYTCASYLKFAHDIPRAAPVEMIFLCDRPLCDRPLDRARTPFGLTGYFWVPFDPNSDTFEYHNCVIPEFLWDYAAAFRDKPFAETVEDSYRWLSWACLWHARKLAQLPQWLPRNPDKPVFKAPTPGVPVYYFNAEGHPVTITPGSFEEDVHLFNRYAVEKDADLIGFKGFAAWNSSDVFAGTTAHTVAQEHEGPSAFATQAGIV